MTDHQFYLCWGECSNYTDRYVYISDMSLSSIYDDTEDADIPQDRIDQLSQIWDVHHMTISAIRAASGLSQARFAEHFCVPRRTVEDWDAGKRTPPDYVKILIAKSLNLL